MAASIAVLACAAWLALASAAHAVAGDLDPSFGAGGKLVTDFGTADFGEAVAIQPGGKIVVAGWTVPSGGAHFALARYDSDGTLDASFGTGGKQITSFAGGGALARAMAIQPDGKIVVVGTLFSGGSDFALARYDADGDLDTSFDGDGRQTTDIGNDEGEDVAIQPDGKIVLAGSSDQGSAGGGDNLALARYNTDGTLDTASDVTPGTSFDTDGVQTTDFGGEDGAHAVAIQPDGKIVAAGRAGVSAGYDLALARYTPAGALDTTFDGDGRQTADLSSFDVARAVAFQAGGAIVTGGTSSPSGEDFLLARHGPAGTLDTSFDGDGKQTTDFSGHDSGHAMAMQPDGKIVLAGHTGGGNFALARYGANGDLDASFGTAGKLTTDFGGIDEGKGVALQVNGGIVMAGSSDQGGCTPASHTTSCSDFALVRYQGDPQPDPDPGAGSSFQPQPNSQPQQAPVAKPTGRRARAKAACRKRYRRNVRRVGRRRAAQKRRACLRRARRLPV